MYKTTLNSLLSAGTKQLLSAGSLLSAGTQLLPTLNQQAAADFLKYLMCKFKQSSSRHLFYTLPLLCCCRANTLCMHPVTSGGVHFFALQCVQTAALPVAAGQIPIKAHTAREKISSSTEQICPESAFGCSRLVLSCCLGCKYPKQILALTVQKSCTLLTKIKASGVTQRRPPAPSGYHKYWPATKI